MEFFRDTDILNTVKVNHLWKVYKYAEPFPHIVVNGLFNPVILGRVRDEFPYSDSDAWNRKIKHEHSIKMGSNLSYKWGHSTRRVMSYLNGSVFLSFLEYITGIKRLIADNDYNGGGLHNITSGGFLKIHADFNRLPNGLDRRLNVLVYLNHNWQDKWGGHLELWDKDLKKCHKKVAPELNTMVVFNTTSDSFHGHPKPLACPKKESRKSLALYYYTKGRPEKEKKRTHNTLYKKIKP